MERISAICRHSRFNQSFPNSVGMSDILSTDGKVKVWLIGPDETWDIAADEIEPIESFT